MIIRHFIVIQFILFLSFSLNSFTQQNTEIDSLLQVLNKNIKDTTRLNVLIKLADKYSVDVKSIFKARKYAEKAFQLADEKGLETSFTLHWAMARINHYSKKNHEGLEQMKIALEKISPDESKSAIAKANNFLGLLYLYLGRFSESLDTYNANIEFSKKHRLKNILPATYSYLAYLHSSLGNTEESRDALSLMIEYAENENDIGSQASAYYRLGEIGMTVDSNFSYAIENYNKSLEIIKELKDTTQIAFILLRLGWNHYLNGELNTALDYFFYSLEFSLPNNLLMSVTNAYGNIGTIYRDKKEYDKAIENYKESIKYSHMANDWYNLSWLYKDMSDMFKTLGKYQDAYENLIEHKRYSDSLESKRYMEDLSNARIRFEADKAEKELELLTFKLKQHKYFTYGFAGLIAFIVLIGILLLRQNKLSSKRRISEMNHKVSEVTQKNLRQQMNPHFIFNTLNSIQYYMYQHDKISTNNYLTMFSSLMRKTLENSQHTSIPIKDELDALELYLKLESLRFKEKFDYKISVDDEIDTLLYKIPTMLIQPYVENAICHGLINKDEKGYLNVDLKLQDKSIACTIEDNGIGREAAQNLQNNRDENHNSLGTTITESRLKLVNALYGKEMKIDYTDLQKNDGTPCGTKVVIHIPIMT